MVVTVRAGFGRKASREGRWAPRLYKLISTFTNFDQLEILYGKISTTMIKSGRVGPVGVRSGLAALYRGGGRCFSLFAKLPGPPEAL